MDDDNPTNPPETVQTVSEPQAQPAQPQQSFDPARLDPVLRFLNRNEDALKYAMEKVTVISDTVAALELQLAKSEIMRQSGIPDEHASLIEGKTAAEMTEKATKLAEILKETLKAQEAAALASETTKPESRYQLPRHDTTGRPLTPAEILARAEEDLLSFGK